jgi:hypothetical protein
VASRFYGLYGVMALMVQRESTQWPVPEELQESTKERGFLVDWAHKKNGWNSTLEGIVAGVPMVCWPTIADQQINSFLLTASFYWDFFWTGFGLT